MTPDELSKAIFQAETDLRKIFASVPGFAKAAVPELVRESEEVIHNLGLIRTRLLLEGVSRGEAEKSEHWCD